MSTAGALVADVVFPAMSETDADAVSPVPSPPMTESAGSVSGLMPDSASDEAHAITTSPLYQPFPFGAVVGDPLSDGAVVSMLRTTEVDALLPATSLTLPVAV